MPICEIRGKNFIAGTSVKVQIQEAIGISLESGMGVPPMFFQETAGCPYHSLASL